MTSKATRARVEAQLSNSRRRPGKGAVPVLGTGLNVQASTGQNPLSVDRIAAPRCSPFRSPVRRIEGNKGADGIRTRRQDCAGLVHVSGQRHPRPASGAFGSMIRATSGSTRGRQREWRTFVLADNMEDEARPRRLHQAAQSSRFSTGGPVGRPSASRGPAS
jgi:hypothetical protein